MEPEVIPLLHSVGKANAFFETDGVANQKIGIFKIHKLDETVNALLNTSSSLSHPQLKVTTKQKSFDVHSASNHFRINNT